VMDSALSNCHSRTSNLGVITAIHYLPPAGPPAISADSDPTTDNDDKSIIDSGVGFIINRKQGKDTTVGWQISE
jgi:hypothetical protein